VACATRTDSLRKPQVFVREIERRLRDDAIVACGSSTIATWWVRPIPARRGDADMLVFGERETADQLLSGHHHVGNGTGGLVLDPAPAAIVEEAAGDPLRARGRVERIGTLTNPTARLPVRSPGGGMARFGTSRVPSALS
jgi:hypothetical protein